MELANLPVEILSHILDGESSWAAIELWKCGDVVLNSKLCRGGIKNVDLLHLKRRDTTSRWPRCLKEFRLEKLSICRTAGLCSAETLRSELKKLHSGLKTLKIQSLEAIHAIFPSSKQSSNKSLNSDDNDKPPSSKRAKVKESDHGDQKYGELWNLDVTFPEMEELVILGHSLVIPGQPSRSSRSPAIFALLPRTLTSFAINCSFNVPIDSFDTFPVGLKKLHLEPGFISEAAFKNFPASITDIGISLSENLVLELARHPELAPNLKMFPCAENGVYRSLLDKVLGKNEIAWPDNVLELSFDEQSSDFIFQKPLPNQLRILDLTTMDDMFNSVLLTALVPKTLTTLHLEEIDWKDINASLWPPNLVRFRLEYDEDLSVKHFHRLPRSLTELSILECYRGNLGVVEESSIPDSP